MTDTTRWAFYHPQRAWYRDTLPTPGVLDEILLEVQALHDGENDGVEFEFPIVWTESGGEPTPQLRVFDDAWAGVLRAETEHGLLTFLAGRDQSAVVRAERPPVLTPDDLRAWCLEHGFVDVTPYTREGSDAVATVATVRFVADSQEEADRFREELERFADGFDGILAKVQP